VGLWPERQESWSIKIQFLWNEHTISRNLKIGINQEDKLRGQQSSSLRGSHA